MKYSWTFTNNEYVTEWKEFRSYEGVRLCPKCRKIFTTKTSSHKKDGFVAKGGYFLQQHDCGAVLRIIC
jgi:hypothetical protein